MRAFYFRRPPCGNIFSVSADLRLLTSAPRRYSSTSHQTQLLNGAQRAPECQMFRCDPVRAIPREAHAFYAVSVSPPQLLNISTLNLPRGVQIGSENRIVLWRDEPCMLKS